MALGDAGDEVSSSSSSPPLLLLFRDAGGAWRVGGDCRARRKMTVSEVDVGHWAGHILFLTLLFGVDGRYDPL